MEEKISVIIPCYNSAATIRTCLEAVFASDYRDFEVIVVDDGSTDGSADIIRAFPCRLISLEQQSGASKARNSGAQNSSGVILFFIDADCVVFPDTLSRVHTVYTQNRDAITGGTYTPAAHDDTFFSTFQSVFVHYSETKKKEPDYVATHAMIISRDLFEKSGGFPEEFLPILEDVEFSHRLRRQGQRLVMSLEIQVRHIFNFTLLKSLRNAYRKSRYWVMYSLKNRDVLQDSGTASVELKVNVLCWFLSWCFAVIGHFLDRPFLLVPVLLLSVLNIFTSRDLFKAFSRAKGPLFSLKALAYYTVMYPVPVGAGSLAGMIAYFLQYKR